MSLLILFDSHIESHIELHCDVITKRTIKVELNNLTLNAEITIDRCFLKVLLKALLL